MNRHSLIDSTPMALTGRLLSDEQKLAGKSIESPGFEEHLDAVSVEVPEIQGRGISYLQADTLVGELEPAFSVGRWLGSEYPTIIYHHGHRERPFSKIDTANSFRRVLLEAEPPIEANLIVVRAPFNDLGPRAHLKQLRELSNFVAMNATSVAVVERLVDQLRARGDGAPITVSGLSLGGFVSNLHRTFYGSADEYVPMLAGTRYDDVVLSGAYRHITSERVFQNADRIRELLDFSTAFQESSGGEVRPLLSRHDAIVRYHPQRHAYGDLRVRTIEKGHLTGALDTESLREHVLAGRRERVAAQPS